MRQLRILPFLLLGLVIGCSEIERSEADAGKGGVLIGLSTSGEHLTKADASAEQSIDVNGFDVEIYKADSGIRLYRDTYANAVGKQINLNVGNYYLLAQYNRKDSLSVAFDAPYFEARQDFSVSSQTVAEVDAVASLANVRARVTFGPNLIVDYPEHYAILRAGGKSLKVEPGETRFAYFPPGEVAFELYAKVGDVWKYSPQGTTQCSGNDFIDFYVDTKPGVGSLELSISIDKSVDVVPLELVTLDASMLPKDAPAINFDGFGDAPVELVEAVALPKEVFRTDIVAQGLVSKCLLEFNSPYAEELGLSNVKFDLCDAADANALLFRNGGLSWGQSIKGSRFAYLDFTSLMDRMKDLRFDASKASQASAFTVTVVDEIGQETSKSFSINYLRPEFSFSVLPADARARRIENLTATLERGNPEVFKLQYKLSGESSWTDAVLANQNGTTRTYHNLTALTPSTAYDIRAIYNGDETTAVKYSLTTEAAMQVGNADMEEWQTLTHKFSYNFIGSSSKPINWDLPYTGEDTNPWWSVNSKKTMPNSSSVASANWNWVRFPSVGWTTDCASGSKAAMIWSVAVEDGSSGVAQGSNKSAGELFIGTADNGGNPSYGKNFASRPDKIRFKYKYESYDSEKGQFELKLLSGSTELFSAVKELPASGWTSFELPLLYSDSTKKATEIRLVFKSSTKSKPATRNTTIVYRNAESYTGNFGSILRIDDIELIYE